MKRWRSLVCILFLLSALPCLAQQQRPPRITRKIVDGHQEVTVHRLETQPAPINPALEIGRVPILFAEGDSVIFVNGCNFSQPTRETLILTVYPYNNPNINLFLRGVNGKNCIAPAHAVIEGGMWAQYNSYLVEDVEIQTDNGYKRKQRFDDIADVHGTPSVKQHHYDRRNAKLLTKTITPQIKAAILAEAQELADAWVLLDEQEQQEWLGDDGVFDLFVAVARVMVDAGVVR